MLQIIQTRTLQKLQIEKLQEAVKASHAQMLYGDGNALQIIVSRQSLLAAQLQQLSSEYEQIESYITLFSGIGRWKIKIKWHFSLIT